MTLLIDSVNGLKFPLVGHCDPTVAEKQSLILSGHHCKTIILVPQIKILSQIENKLKNYSYFDTDFATIKSIMYNLINPKMPGHKYNTSYKIFVVEDNMLYAQVLKKQLVSDGYNVKTFHNGRDFLAILMKTLM